jgi:nucleoside-diphosphate-sugar epimerase
MLRAVASGRFPPPPRVVAQRRAMIHVDDVAEIALASWDRVEPIGGAWVLSDGVAYTAHGIYAAMRAALGRAVPSVALPFPVWRGLARAGDAIGAVTRRRAPFDSVAFDKLFGSAWYEPDDVRAVFGLERLRTLDDALPAMVARLGR